MKKCIFAILSLLVLSSAFASDPATKPKHFRKIAQEEIKCGTTATEVIKQVQTTPGCFEAINVAKECAWGLYALQIVSAAQVICEKDLKKITKDDSALKAQMLRRCESICSPQTETMCIAQISFCRLSATEYWAQFYSSGM